ncbi:2411_t:CDS:2, partial [Acaulospora colombiana]
AIMAVIMTSSSAAIGSASTRSPNEAARVTEDHENPRSAPLLTRTTSNFSHREPQSASRSGHQSTASQPSGDFNAQHRGGTGIGRIFNMSRRTKRRERSASAAAATVETHHPSLSISGSVSEGKHSGSLTLLPPQAPPPKLEYVKLPGVEYTLTTDISFLAILCGDHGEKVELFAGTYRTALALSRTFILPDSPKTLELQLQGDDLVEVFLVFSQNVFGLEPATVRVREVRIGRAERRAARRRANRGANRMPTDENNAEPMAADED